MKYWNIQVYSVRKQLNFRAPIFVSKELRKTSFERSWTFLLKSIEVTRMFITCKVSMFWVIPVCMFPHLTGMSRFLEYISLFSPNRDTQGSKSPHSVRMQEKKRTRKAMNADTFYAACKIYLSRVLHINILMTKNFLFCF